MAKYTDEQIKTALDAADVFLRNRVNAKPTPLNKYDKEALLDIANTCDEAVSLINCQETEIDELSSAILRLVVALENAKSQAAKEFAERLKKSAFDCDVSFGFGREHYTEAVTVFEIDNLVKEMVGEGE